ncbi:pentapeptide repeat-containing protein, partial [Streptosporangium sp. NPDC051023]|uniref:WD40 domain-containing protein n=1 Tax=Streptosporangium sp. NPDC051023 TaxID=3155410 RepID=UPI00345087B5
MSTERSITVLHVSDMQFGREHRFGAEGVTAGDRRFSSLAARLLEDVAWLGEEHGVRPDLVVASGDLAEWALPTEFARVGEFLTELSEGLELGRERVVMVPGNHDVSWKKCQAYFDDCEGDETTPAPPYWPKWQPYFTMFSRFYADISSVGFPKDQPWTLFEIPELKTVVAGLNSTIAESHREADHYGYCGEEQLHWFAERLRGHAERGWLRIGVMHHNPQINDQGDDAFLHDRDRFEELLAPHLHVLLHGHTHEGRIGSFGADGLPVLCAGSAGVRKQARPEEVPNQYQVIRLSREGLTVYGRRYNASRSRWEGDTGVGRRPDEVTRTVRRSFDRADATFPTPDSDGDRHKPRRRGRKPFSVGNARPAKPHDDLLSRVRRVCEVRHPHATVEEVTASGGRSPGYLRVTLPGEPQVSLYPVGVHEGTPDQEVVEAFLTGVDARYRAGDPHLTSFFVYDGAPVPEELRLRTGMRGLRLQRLVEFQGMYDLQPYARGQAERLADSEVYPSALYVPQRFSVVNGRERMSRVESDLLERLREWVADYEGRFVVVLGDFGHGKTFLLRELTRLIHEEGVPPVIPILIQLRDLEKAHGLDELLAAHLTAGGEEVIDHRLLRYLIQEGRVLLLFDGFDELALRVTYEQAAEHLSTLVQAAQGRAKVVLTSRTQYFLSDRQVETALAGRLAGMPGRRLVKIHDFDDAQILAFLTRLLDGDEAGARARLELLRDVRDLLGLSRNPRMLSFIARLEKDRLRRIRDHEGAISAAVLYRELLQRWLEFEYDRAQPRGATPSLSVEDRWEAVRTLALQLWNSGEETLDLDKLGGAAGALESLADLQLTLDQASHMIGSGTLLVRPEAGRFRFVHRSVMEWLVAERVAEQLRRNNGEGPSELLLRPLSELMADFVTELAGRAATVDWARSALWAPPEAVGEAAKLNALTLLRRLGASMQADASARQVVRLPGVNLRGADLQGIDLRDADLSGADLREARLDGADLSGANLRGATLRQSSGVRLRLLAADLTGADLSLARLVEADLTGARTRGTRWSRAVLLRAVASPALLGKHSAFGAVRPLDSASAVQLTFPQDGFTRTIVWSPDGSLLASAYGGKRVRIWDSATGVLVRTLGHHVDWVYSVAWSPDAVHLVTGGDDGTVRIWDPATGTLIHTLEGHTGSVNSVTWGPYGSRLATGGHDGTVRIWDPATGTLVHTLEGHTGSVNSVAWAPRDVRLATGGDDGTVCIWDAVTGALTHSFEGHAGWVRSVAWNPDGTRFATGGNDSVIRIWDAATGTLTHTLEGHASRVRSVAWNPDGVYLASGGNDSVICIWDAATGTLTHTLEDHGGSVNSVAWGPDGTHLAIGGDDSVIRLWNFAGTFTHGEQAGSVNSVAWSPDQAHLATCGNDGTVHIWNTATGTLTRALEGHTDWVYLVAWSPDGTHLATGGNDGTVCIWNAVDGTLIHGFKGHPSRVYSVAWSPDGTHLATGGNDSVIRVWNTATGTLTHGFEGHSGWVRSVAWSPDGTHLATGGDDGTVRVWNTATGTLTHGFEGHSGWVRSVAWSPDGT